MNGTSFGAAMNFSNNYLQAHMTNGSLLIAPVFFVAGIFFFLFWLWMLIDAIKYQKEDKLMWVALVVYLNVIGAIIYYFIAKNKRVEVKVEKKI